MKSISDFITFSYRNFNIKSNRKTFREKVALRKGQIRETGIDLRKPMRIPNRSGVDLRFYYDVIRFYWKCKVISTP